MIRLPLIVAILAAGSFCGCRKEAAPAASGSPVVARAGGEVITVADLEKEVQRRTARNLPVPAKEALVQEMLERLAAVARARKNGLDADPDTRHEMENVLIAKLRAAELEAKVAALTVTDEEVSAAFARGESRQAQPPKVRFALLHLQGDAGMSEAKRTELRGRMEEALAKADAAPAEGGRGGAALGFGEVAAAYSDDQVSRYRGGDIGWLDDGNFSYRWPKAVLEAGYALETGKRSGIIEDNGNLYVIMKTDARESAATTLEQAAPALRRRLLAEKRAAVESAFLSENRSQTGAEIISGTLSAGTLPVSTPRPATAAEPAPPALPGMNQTSRR